MQKVRIDFDNPGLPQHISAVENDSQSRFFQATLYENGKAYTAPEGAAYSIMYSGFGPQNQGWYDTINDGAGKRAACAVSGNVVTCEIARQVLQVPGHVSIVLCVTTGKGHMLKSWPIECDCKNDRYDSTAEIQSFFYITQVSNADWNRAIQALEELKNIIDPTLSLSGKAADAKATGDVVDELKEELKNQYVTTDNMLDFKTDGFWTQGQFDKTDQYSIHTANYIAVESGKELYSAFNGLSENYFSNKLHIIVRYFNEETTQVGKDTTFSWQSSTRPVHYLIPDGATKILVCLTTASYNDKVTPQQIMAINPTIYLGYTVLEALEDAYKKYIWKPDKLESDFEQAKNSAINTEINANVGSRYLLTSDTEKFNLYGFFTKKYEVKSLGTWQSKSDLTISNIDVEGKDVLAVGCRFIRQWSQNIGYLRFFNSAGETLKTHQMSNANKTNENGLYFKTTTPDDAVSAQFTLYGIGNYLPENAPSVGDVSIIEQAYAYTGTISNTKSHIHAWENRIQEIQTAQKNSICFGIQTDSHYYTGLNDNVGKNLSELSQLVPFDFIANLGDIIQGYNTTRFDTHDYMRKSMTDIVSKYINGTTCPVLFALGNHDSNFMYANKTSTDEFGFDELFGRLIKPVYNTAPNVSMTNGKHYYYLDVLSARIIVLNTCDGATPHSFGVSSAQIDWFKKEALNTDKPIIVLSHMPLISSFENANYTASYAQIQNALIAHKNNGKTVIACICGHIHTQESHTSDGILHIGCTENYRNENTAEIFLVDVSKKTIKTFGFGDAKDREFTFL